MVLVPCHRQAPSPASSPPLQETHGGRCHPQGNTAPSTAQLCPSSDNNCLLFSINPLLSSPPLSFLSSECTFVSPLRCGEKPLLRDHRSPGGHPADWHLGSPFH